MPVDVLDDEMPVAPPTEGSTEGAPQEVEIDGAMTAEIVKEAVDMGEPIPVGTYHFKLESYRTGGKANDDGQGVDPYFNCQFTCLDPKYTNRKVFSIITWVRKVDFQARLKCRNRLGNIKQLQEAAGFNPQGEYNVKSDFLDKSPEVKIQLGVRERKSLNPVTKKYDLPTGIQENFVVKFVPLLRR
jgi:hypothetical protein